VCDNRRVNQAEGYNRLARKLIHFGGGALALLLPFFPDWVIILGALLALTIGFWVRPSRSQWLLSVTKPEDRRASRIHGVRSYFITVLTMLLAGMLLERSGDPHGMHYATFGWLALAWGDGLAGLLGPGPDRTATVPWNRRKTWLGVLGCVIGVFSAFLTAFNWPPGEGLGLAPLLLPALICALVTAAGESCRFALDDNYVTGFTAFVMALLCFKLFFPTLG
jgi:dolichol kinase